MSNIKRFFLYSMLVSMSLVSGIILMEGSPLRQNVNVVEYVSLGAIKASCMFLSFVIFLSWVNNIYFYLYLKEKGYSFVSVNLFPFTLINDIEEKIKIDFWFFSIMQIQSVISMQKLNSYEECNKYVIYYKKCIKNIVRIQKIMFICSLGIGIWSLPLCVFLCGGIMTVQCFYGMQGTDLMTEGLRNFGTKKENEFCLFLNADLENYDKKVMYKIVQNNFIHDNFIENKIFTLYEKNFICQILIDSIYDEKIYLVESMSKHLDEMFLNCNSSTLRNYSIGYMRLIYLFYVYLLLIKRNDHTVSNIITNNLKILKDKCGYEIMGNKVLDSVDKKEMLNEKYRYRIYRNKVEEVYDKFSVLDKI